MAVPPRPNRPPRRCPARRAVASHLVRRRRRLARALRYRLRAMGATTRRRRSYMAIQAVRGQPLASITCALERSYITPASAKNVLALPARPIWWMHELVGSPVSSSSPRARAALEVHAARHELRLRRAPTPGQPTT